MYHHVYNVFGKIEFATLIIQFLHFLRLKSNPNVFVKYVLTNLWAVLCVLNMLNRLWP